LASFRFRLAHSSQPANLKYKNYCKNFCDSIIIHLIALE